MAREALKKKSRLTLQYGDIADIGDALGKESDRSLAIVAATILEGALESILIEALARKSALDALFRGGPLGSFSAKTEVGYAFGIFGPQTRATLDCIRDIRNAFAHAGHLIDFNTPEVVSACETLPNKGSSAREQYWTTAWNLCWELLSWSKEADEMQQSPDPEDRDRNPRLR